MESSFFFEQYSVGSMQNFNYVLGCPSTREGASFDPAFEPQKAIDILEKKGCLLQAVFLTHNHWDHIDGLPYLIKRCQPTVYVHALDQGPIQEMTQKIHLVCDGEEISWGDIKIRVIHTPGHTPGSACYLIHQEILVSGDTLFQGNCGRCDLPGGSARQMFESLHLKLKRLKDQILVYPGHDYGVKPVSTVGYERGHNPTMMAACYEDFVKIP